MFLSDGLVTAQSVSDGHPDKLADRIADAVVDEVLRREPAALVACDVMLVDQVVRVAARFTVQSTSTVVALRDGVPGVVRQLLQRGGHGDDRTGIDPITCTVQVDVNVAIMGSRVRTEPDFWGGGTESGCTVVGYASAETPELMPVPVVVAHRLMRRHRELRRSRVFPWLDADANVQLTWRYQGGRPKAVESVVLASQHAAMVHVDQVRVGLQRELVDAVIPDHLRAPGCQVIINPSGRFVEGGPKRANGVSGRRGMVDLYGNAAPPAAAALSGRDPSLPVRSGTYMARFLARQVVTREWGRRALVQLTYATGVAEPVQVTVLVDEGQGGGAPAGRGVEIAAALRREYDLSIPGIIRLLHLQRPIYTDLAVYGHVGRTDVVLPWEQVMPPGIGGAPVPVVVPVPAVRRVPRRAVPRVEAPAPPPPPPAPPPVPSTPPPASPARAKPARNSSEPQRTIVTGKVLDFLVPSTRQSRGPHGARGIAVQVALQGGQGGAIEWLAVQKTLRKRFRELAKTPDMLLDRTFEFLLDGNGEVIAFRPARG
jgi:S-adenosylmethionine synthetase